MIALPYREHAFTCGIGSCNRCYTRSSQPVFVHFSVMFCGFQSLYG